MKKFVLCLAVLAAMNTAAFAADYVLGDFETGFDGWGTWSSNAVQPNPANFALSTTNGVTRGSSSLQVTQSGWAQGLALNFDGSQRAAFMSHDTFSIDMSVAANDGTITGGYTQIYSVALNGEGGSFSDVVTGTPVNFYWWEGSGARTLTLSFNYSAYRDTLVANPGWIQMILALNTGGGAPAQMYFDNAKLSGVPEPATMTLLGLGLALLRKRK
jgi:hypothetical protein